MCTLISFKATSLSALSARMPFRPFRNSSPSLYLRNLLLLFTGLLLLPSSNAAVAIHKVSLSCDTQVASAGYYRLYWRGDEQHAEYRLLESDTPLFSQSKVVYQGREQSTVISDRPNGDYYYRVVELKDATPLTASNTVKVVVLNKPQNKAWWLSAIGAALLLLMLFWRYWSKRKSRGGES